MSENDFGITELSEDDALGLMSTVELGRLVVRHDDDLDLFPVNFVLHEGAVYFRTAEGTKLAALTLDERVLFEVDQHSDADAWSVVVKGRARRLETHAEIEEVDTLGLRPWIRTYKYNYVAITPDVVSGRRFRLGAEPEHHTG